MNRRVDGGRIRRLLLADSGEDEGEEKEGGTRRAASASLWQDQHDLYLQDLLSFEEGWRDEDEVEEDGTKSDDDSSPPSSSSPSSFLHHPLRIRFESSELDAWASLSPEYALRVQYLTHRVLPSMSQIWSSALRVVPVSGLLRIDRDWCPFGDPDHPSFGVDGGGRGMEDVDLLVYLTANGEACGGGDDDYGSDGLYRSGGDRDKGMGGSGGGGNGDDGDDGYGSDGLYRSGGDGDGDEGKGSGGGGGGGNGVLASAVSCFWDQYDRPVAGNIDFCLGTVELGRESDDMDRPGGDSPSSASSGTTASRVDGGSRRREDRADEKKEKESSSDRLLEMAVGTATHEFAHILGITSADLLYYYDWRTGLPRTPDPVMKRVQCVGRLSGGGAAASEAWEDHYVPLETTLKPGRTPGGALYYEITTPTVAQVVRNQFDCPSATGARLENQPTSGDCFGNHFDERLFFSENMSPVLAGIPEVMLSSLTLATLRDTGWYVPDFSVARVSPFGNGAGCDFLYEDCLDRDWGGALTPSSEGYFCNQMYGFDDKGKFAGGYGCDPTHTHVSICDLVDYGTLRVPYDPPPAEYRYFDGDSGEGDDYDGGGRARWGGLMETADFCPTFSIDPISCEDVVRLGGGEEGEKRRSQEGSAFSPHRHPFPNLKGEAAEIESRWTTTSTSQGLSSPRCFDTDNAPRPICLEATCDPIGRRITVHAGPDLSWICEYSGQKHNLSLSGGGGGGGGEGKVLLSSTPSSSSFICPRFSSLCPDVECPSNCAGAGTCVRSSSSSSSSSSTRDGTAPGCSCFDRSDDTPGCWRSSSYGLGSVPPRGEPDGGWGTTTTTTRVAAGGARNGAGKATTVAVAGLILFLSILSNGFGTLSDNKGWGHI